jgi:hypothetical protein
VRPPSLSKSRPRLRVWGCGAGRGVQRGRDIASSRREGGDDRSGWTWAAQALRECGRSVTRRRSARADLPQKRKARKIHSSTCSFHESVLPCAYNSISSPPSISMQALLVAAFSKRKCHSLTVKLQEFVGPIF